MRSRRCSVLELVPSATLDHRPRASWAGIPLGARRLPVPRDELRARAPGHDLISRSTESTSILTDALIDDRIRRSARDGSLGESAEEVSHSDLRARLRCRVPKQPSEPAIALYGIDNAVGRQALDDAGVFLDRRGGHSDVVAATFARCGCTLPGSRHSTEMWKNAATSEDVTGRAAYQRLREQRARPVRRHAPRGQGRGRSRSSVPSRRPPRGLADPRTLAERAPVDQLIDLDLQASIIDSSSHSSATSRPQPRVPARAVVARDWRAITQKRDVANTRSSASSCNNLAEH